MKSRGPYGCSKVIQGAAMPLFQTNPVGVEFSSYVNGFFCFNKCALMLATWVKTLDNRWKRGITEHSHKRPKIYEGLRRFQRVSTFRNVKITDEITEILYPEV